MLRDTAFSALSRSLFSLHRESHIVALNDYLTGVNSSAQAEHRACNRRYFSRAEFPAPRAEQFSSLPAKRRPAFCRFSMASSLCPMFFQAGLGRLACVVLGLFHRR